MFNSFSLLAQVFSQFTFNVINDIYFIGVLDAHFSNLTSLKLECIHCWPSNSCDSVVIAWACAATSLEWVPAAWKEIPETAVEPFFITQALNDTEFEVVWKSTDIFNSDSKWEKKDLEEIDSACEGALEISSPIYFTWCKQVTLWKRPWFWERVKAKEEGEIGWDGWMASPIQRTRTWTNSGRWWEIGKPGMLQSMGSQSQT